MSWGDLYGMAAAATVFLAMASKRDCLVKVALALMASWAVSTGVAAAGYRPEAFALIDLFVLGYCLAIWQRGKHRFALVTATLSLVALASHVAFKALDLSSSASLYNYVLTLNMLFTAQLMIVGGVAGRDVVVAHLRSLPLDRRAFSFGGRK